MNTTQVSDAQVQTNNQNLEVNIDNVSNNDSPFSSYATTINGEYFTPPAYETGQTNITSSELAFVDDNDDGVNGDSNINVRRSQDRLIQCVNDYLDRSHREALLSKFEYILRQLGININEIRNASSNTQLDLLLQSCINGRIAPYQTLTKKLNYGPSDIARVRDFDAVVKRLKKRFIKNTGRAQYYNTRFGETPPFNLVELGKLAKAFSKIEFVGADDHTKKRYIKVWSVFLSTSREDMGRNVPAMRIHTRKIDIQTMIPKTRKKLILKDINKAFTRDVFIDCRLHEPSEIKAIFLLAQGLRS